MFQQYILNGQAHGQVADQMRQVAFDPGLMRPFVEDGRSYVTVNTGRSKFDEALGRNVPETEAVLVSDMVANGAPLTNATLGLQKDEWINLDNVVLRAARQRLRAWSDLAAANTYGGFNGMANMVLEHEVMSDPGEAVQDMDGLTEGSNDAPKFQLRGLPLPITHSDFSYSSRRLAASRNNGTPLDMSSAEAAARRVAETIEKSVIGTVTGMKFGSATDYDQNSQVYGYLDHPDRATKTDLTAPTATNGTTVVDEVLEMRELLYNSKFYGPYMLYVSTNYDRYLDNDFKTNSDKTTRQRINEIDSIQGVRRLDFLSGDRMILVQMTGDVARAVDGMGITTMQWDTKGGMQTNFKVMAIQVPQIRSDINGNCGVAVGTTS